MDCKEPSGNKPKPPSNSQTTAQNPTLPPPQPSALTLAQNRLTETQKQVDEKVELMVINEEKVHEQNQNKLCESDYRTEKLKNGTS